mmetsp:Transcript_4065/g.8355  ORF Transcript_4065/g.8355 Transcript_4065/m.8355 type:complete len:297 (+) Transcript_4065:584-1474(+)
MSRNSAKRAKTRVRCSLGTTGTLEVLARSRQRACRCKSRTSLLARCKTRCTSNQSATVRRCSRAAAAAAACLFSSARCSSCDLVAAAASASLFFCSQASSSALFNSSEESTSNPDASSAFSRALRTASPSSATWASSAASAASMAATAAALAVSMSNPIARSNIASSGDSVPIGASLASAAHRAERISLVASTTADAHVAAAWFATKEASAVVWVASSKRVVDLPSISSAGLGLSSTTACSSVSCSKIPATVPAHSPALLAAVATREASSTAAAALARVSTSPFAPFSTASMPALQ